MADNWQPIPLDAELFRNLDESVLRKSPARLENLFITEAKGQGRVPGLRRQQLMGAGMSWDALPGGGLVYLNDWRGNLVAVTSHGRVFRVDTVTMAFEDVTEVPVAGNGRVIFAQSDDQLIMAAGQRIVQLRSDKTEILSEEAPLSTHVGYLGGYVLAIEVNSQRFAYCNPGEFTVWNPIDFFSAESTPDKLTALVVTEFNEALLAGPKSIEQYEIYPGGDRPFFRRFSVGTGLIAPYTLTAADNGVWGINNLQEFSLYAGQNAKPQSLSISLKLEEIADFEGAWASPPMHLFGQKFIFIHLPKALNDYGTKGVTLLHDYKERRWAWVYGWNDELNIPGPWPGNSYHRFGGQHYVGGLNGEIYKFDNTYFLNDGKPQLATWQSATFDAMGSVICNNLRFRFKRGDPVTGYDQDPVIQLRVRHDRQHWGPWQTKHLGASGNTNPYVYFGSQGSALGWEFQTRCAANCPLDIVSMEGLFERVN